MDSTDQHLLGLLQSNARESAASLARKLKIARTTVLSRIDRLERQGVIAGYGLRLGQKIDDGSIQVFCGMKTLPRAAPTVIKALERMHEVQEVCAVSGRYDYMVTLQCTGAQRLDAILDHLGQIDGVLETHSSVVLSTKFSRRGVLPRIPIALGTSS